MSTALYNHLNREFRTEHKVFLLSVERGGQSVKIVERNRVKDFNLSFELGGANWLCDTILEAVEAKRKVGFFRKFRGSSYVLLAIVDTNKRGSFFRLDKVHEGKMSSIIVPNGIESRGWRDLRNCLLSMLGRETMCVERREVGSVLYQEKQRFFGLKGVQKNWRLAVVIYRSSSKESWEGIRDGFCRKLGRAVDISTLHANRAILWCRDEKEKGHLLTIDSCKLNNVKPVKVVKWSQQQHWEDIVFQGQNIWVGIEGIPLNWWNVHVLRVIGTKLGGVLEIAEETLQRSFLTYAKIRVSGLSSGFLPSVLELPWGSDIVMLGIFPLIDGQPSYSVGSGRALGPAFRRGEVLRRSFAVLKSHPQEVLQGSVDGAFNNNATVAGCGELAATSSVAAIQKQYLQPVWVPKGRVGYEEGTALNKDKAAAKNLGKVISEGFDRSQKPKKVRLEEAEISPFTAAFSDRAEGKEVLAASDTPERAIMAGLLDGRASVRKISLGESNYGEKYNRSHLFQAQTSTFAEKLTANKETSFLPLKNRFQPLFNSSTCSSVDPELFPPLTGLGLEKMSSKGQPMKGVNNRLQYLDPSALLPASDRLISPGHAFSDFEATIYHKTKATTTGLHSIRAHSEPTTGFNCLFKGTRKTKQFRPKNYRDFTKGQILSWEDFEYHGNWEKKKEKKKGAVTKEKHSGISVLKVYSRNKKKKVPTKEAMLTQDDEFFEGCWVGSEQNLEGDSKQIDQVDDISLSSSSDSDETFLSDKISEKEDDKQLEGLSLLLDNSIPTEEFMQSEFLPESKIIPEPSDNSFKGDISPTTDKEVVENVSACLDKNAQPPNELDELGFKRNRSLDWKNAQVLLTQMGIQLIHDTKETKKGGIFNKTRGKKGSRELQNLRFNVNYEGSSSSKGISSSP